MELYKTINKLRVGSNISQERFATMLKVSRQTVQKWENGTSTPELNKLIKIAKYFDIPLDTLVLGNNARIADEQLLNNTLKPNYANLSPYESYSAGLEIEYQQSIEEGLNVEAYKELVNSVSKLPQNEIKKKFADTIFEAINSAGTVKDYPFDEPSTLPEIKSLRSKHLLKLEKPTKNELKDKILGAWLGRICGCLLGKPIEGIKSDELIPLLKSSNNYPMHRYIFKSDITESDIEKYHFPLAKKCYADLVNGMPIDDDTNYTALAQTIIEKYGRDFTPYDISRAWLDSQKKDAYCTAERVAYCNFIRGYEPPESAKYKNPYREFIGAQIRGDYFGYINPGNPEKAAEMAFNDASISHIKNGIYGEMFISAMLAIAPCTSNIMDVILGGLAEIPSTSRLYKSIEAIITMYNNKKTRKECLDFIRSQYDEYAYYGWCHTISNAMIVVVSLLYGNADFGKSICMAVESAFDTDCNGATVGSIIGMMHGINCIGEEWKKPINDTLHTTIFGVGTVSISELAEKTMKHIEI